MESNAMLTQDNLDMTLERVIEEHIRAGLVIRTPTGIQITPEGLEVHRAIAESQGKLKH